MRLQVFLSRSGVCSRRDALRFVLEGRVSVNGRTIKEPSTPIQAGKDEVVFKGRLVSVRSYEYIVLNKPKGYVTTVEDKHAQKTVLDLLPRRLRHLHPVGRLDKDTEGLLLLTNDGDLTYRLTHPKFNINKTYMVRVIGRLDNAKIARLERGVRIDGAMTAPVDILKVAHLKNKTLFHIIMHEGRKRQIRRMLSAVGHKVISLKRIKQGPITLDNLVIGQWRPLRTQEVAALKG
ncbi:pseudouridine synthase [Candidatus Omnitrophota bacterium]